METIALKIKFLMIFKKVVNGYIINSLIYIMQMSRNGIVKINAANTTIFNSESNY